MPSRGARTLANEARERLHREGFTDDQIRWAKTLITEDEAGPVSDFIAWIGRQQR